MSYILQLGNGDQIRPAFMTQKPSDTSSALARPETKSIPWGLILLGAVLFLVISNES